MANRVPTFRLSFSLSDRAQQQAAYDAQPERREDNRFYCSRPWRKLRDAYRRKHPLCERCQAVGLIVPTAIVHHKQERKVRPDLALSWGNLEAVCDACHNATHKAKGKPAAPAKGSGFELLQ